MYQSASLELPLSNYSIFYFFDAGFLSLVCFSAILVLYTTLLLVQKIETGFKVEPLTNLHINFSKNYNFSEYLNLVELHRKRLPLKYKLLKFLNTALSIALYIVVIMTIVFIFEFLITNFTKSSKHDANQLILLESSLNTTNPTQASSELLSLIYKAKADGTVTKYEYFKLAKKVTEI